MAGRVGKVAKLEQEAAARQQDFERQARAEAYSKAEEERAARRKAEAEQFMRENNLHTTDDCRSFVIRKAKQLMRVNDRGLFERWCDNMKQVTVDWLVTGGWRDDKLALERLRDAGVIDEANRLIPPKDREEAAAALRAQRELVDEELRHRALDDAVDIAGQA
jgi:hypothetical protein